jgi:hypothetical protein
MKGPVYAERPSKAVTRLVLVEMLHRLAGIQEVTKYQYVGFGALEFIDFALVHRRLGLRNMTSIENKPGQVVRQTANTPYNGIRVLEGDAKDVLPTLDWEPLSIVWLDYECSLNTKSVIPAVEYLALKLRPGSVLAVTLRAEAHKPSSERLGKLKNDIGPERVPAGTTENTLGDWGTAHLQWNVLNSIIRTEVLSRRGGADTWKQLLNIEYCDVTRMQLVAGIVGGPGLDKAIDSCAFESLVTYRPGDSALRIQVPYLTHKEQQHLNERLPRSPHSRLRLPGVPDKEIKDYENAYRWLEPTL